ncbi:MAG TPA: bifunctional metallophosphatase/5'-nucleotidase [Burkholderiales bacterium]|nr:bifunctional metallophosphatase/5'-nucleotidase [Burkholderiales bacterium]
MKTLLVILSFVAMATGCAGLAPQPAGFVDVKILGINDFHGNLKPGADGILIADPNDNTKKIQVAAGGSEHLATLVKDLRAKNTHNVFVAAGDLIGASPMLSAMFHDEPTIESLSIMDLEVTSVGNHEFDHGKDELIRKQKGGCHPKDGCKGPQPFKGARFQYLAASTIDTKSGETIFPAYYVKTFDGVSVAFIGLTLKGTPKVVLPKGIEGLEFKDEADTVNALVPKLKKQNIEAIVVLIHEGGFPTGDYNECPGISGPIVDIVKKFDKAVDLVISGHTHKAYNCVIDGRLVTSGDKYGTIVSEIDVTLDRKTRDIVYAKANNIIVRTDTYAKDPAQTRLIAEYEKLSATLTDRVVGSITSPLLRNENAAGETTLGNVIADAQLAATSAEKDGGAVIAFVNVGAMRSGIAKKEDGKVTYGDIFASQPFSNPLITLTLTGEQIKRILEQQWLDQPKPRVLQVSRGFTYSWDHGRPVGDRVIAESIKLNGQPIGMKQSYRITANEFLSTGGDGFSVMKEGKERLLGVFDLEALEAYLQANSPVSPGKLDRIQRIN